MCLLMKQIYIAMPMYNLIEYSDNCPDTSWSLWQFKRDEIPDNNADFTINKSQLFKYRASFLGETTDAAGGNSFVKTQQCLFH